MKPICFAFHEKDYKSFKRHLSPLRSASRHNKAVTRRTIPNDYFCSASRRKIRGKGVFVASPFSSPFSFSEEVIRPVICPGLSRSAFPIERKRRDSGTKRGCCPGCCPGWDNGFSGDCGRCCPGRHHPFTTAFRPFAVTVHCSKTCSTKPDFSRWRSFRPIADFEMPVVWA